MSETCPSSGRGQKSVAVTTEDLTVRGVDIQVRDAIGNVVAEKKAAKYVVIQQAALCIGMTFGLEPLHGSGVSRFGFFLESR